MIIEILAGLILGIIYNKIDDYFNLEALWKTLVIAIAIAIIAYIGFFSWVFMISFVVGLFIYNEYISQRW